MSCTALTDLVLRLTKLRRLPIRPGCFSATVYVLVRPETCTVGALFMSSALLAVMLTPG
jgi:hypothetical protein